MTSPASALRANPIFFPISVSTTRPSLSSSSSYSSKTLNFALTLTADCDPYGPSLRRGQCPLPSDSGDYAIDSDKSSYLNPSSFSRTFSISALRIPASACSSLENRLRGHLLNWPRIRNVARVAGDDLDPEFRNLLRNSDGDGGQQRLVALSPRGGSEATDAMSPVLYREKLVKDFNCRGFLKFRNLARISRPKKRKKRAEGEGGGGKDREERKVYTVMEVARESEGKEDDMSSLMGADCRAGRWRGSTRLLLLDERHKDKDFEELPEAVKVFMILLAKILLYRALALIRFLRTC